MSELPALLAVLGRRGRVGSVVLVLSGLVLIAFAVVLLVGLGEAEVLGMRGGGEAIGVVLALAVVGLVLVGLGGNSLVGAQAKVDRAGADVTPGPTHPRADPRAAARVEPIPFWICSDCKLVEPGLSGCCVRCGRTVAFFQARGEDDRSIAVSSLH